MNKKGFTLVEVVVVIAIVAIASALVGTQFFSVLGKGGTADKFEKEVIAKSIAEAAYVYIDSKENEAERKARSNKYINYGFFCSDEDKCRTPITCRSATVLLDQGFIPDNQGLLTKCDEACLGRFFFKVTNENNEKKVYVFHKPNVSSYSCLPDYLVEY